ncbi:MAG: S1 RNA-binding domain-containing protein [Lachnospiraceae bacterium]|nr:S1 RNA-binding domain-containing protein [Lachnospiraceae bacterium]
MSEEEKVIAQETNETETRTPTEAAMEAPAETAAEVPVEAAAEAASEAPAEASAEEITETPAEPTAEASEAAAETPAAPATEAPTESMADYDAAITASMKPIHEGDILKGTVIGVSDEELTVDLGIYTDGIVRREDASDDPDFTFRDFEIGQEISATVIRRDNAQGRIQLSLKAAAAVLGWERLQQLQKDQTNITVKISEAVKSGVTAYVEGIRGFIPASKLALSYVENLDEYVGREIEVRVITAEPEGKHLVLSARDILREKEREERKQRISNVEIGLVTEGTVETIKDYGAFINLGKGLSGLVHVSQISQQRVKHPGDVLKEGQKVKVKVIAVKDGKISLSMKALEDVAAQEIEEETYKMPKAENATTSLASLFKNIKL